MLKGYLQNEFSKYVFKTKFNANKDEFCKLFWQERLLLQCSYCLTDRLCWGLMTRQPLWVILCCFPEKGRKEIRDSRGDERGTGKKKEQE